MSERKREQVAVATQMAVSVLFDIVKIEIICGDDYAAQVLYDDLTDRLRLGESIVLSVAQKQPADR